MTREQQIDAAVFRAAAMFNAEYDVGDVIYVLKCFRTDLPRKYREIINKEFNLLHHA